MGFIRFIAIIFMFLTGSYSSNTNKNLINYEQIKINEGDLLKLIAKFANKHNMTVSIKLEKNMESGIGVRSGHSLEASTSEIKVFSNETALSEDKNKFILQKSENDWEIDEEIFEAIFPGFTFDEEKKDGITIEVPVKVTGDGVNHYVNKFAFLSFSFFIFLLY